MLLDADQSSVRVQSVSQSVIPTLRARSTRPTLTLYSGLLSSVRQESLHLLLSFGRSSYFRMVLCSFPRFTYLLVGADLVESGPRQWTRAPAGSSENSNKNTTHTTTQHHHYPLWPRVWLASSFAPAAP